MLNKCTLPVKIQTVNIWVHNQLECTIKKRNIKWEIFGSGNLFSRFLAPLFLKLGYTISSHLLTIGFNIFSCFRNYFCKDVGKQKTQPYLLRPKCYFSRIFPTSCLFQVDFNKTMNFSNIWLCNAKFFYFKQFKLNKIYLKRLYTAGLIIFVLRKFLGTCGSQY